ncbi:hypothetical protein D3C84_1010910 [compost metagenome]
MYPVAISITMLINQGLISVLSLAATRPTPTAKAPETAVIVCLVASVALAVSSVIALRRSPSDLRVSLPKSDSDI